MRMVLDFTHARQTACHSYTGVTARMDNGKPHVVTIMHDGCRSGSIGGETVACGTPEVDHDQAWSVAMLLTRRESVRPAGEPFWNPELRQMSFPMRSSARSRIS